MLRLAKIEIDTAYLKEYKAAIEEHTKAALKQEPGVLTSIAYKNSSFSQIQNGYAPNG